MALKRPVPPSAFLTKDPETREDFRKIREYLRELQDWAFQMAEESGGGGTTGVTSFNGRTGAVVPDVADYSSYYLLRSANDFTTFAAKTALVANDVFLIEDSAASYAKKKVLASAILTPTGFARTGNPYWDGPTTPDAWNDDFTAFDQTGSADLATRGWTVWNHTTGVAMTRRGDIEQLSPTVTVNQYNSRLVGSSLFIQFHNTPQTYFIIKATSGSFQYLMRMGGPLRNGANWYGAFMTTNTSAPFFTAAHNSGAGPGWWLTYKDSPPSFRALGRTVNAAQFFDSSSTTRTEESTDMYGIWNEVNGASSRVYPQWIMSAAGQLTDGASGGGAASMSNGWSVGAATTYAMAGFGIAHTPSTSVNLTSLYTLHSAWRLPLTGWIS